MLEQIGLIVGVTFLVMVSPGPDMLIVLRNTLIGGRSAGRRTSLGVLTGNLVHIGYCIVGIGWLISQSILAFSVLKYAGAAYLIYLGVASFRSDASRLDPRRLPTARSRRAWFVQGLFNNLLNPKGTLFYLGVFTTVITPETGAADTLVLVVCMLAVSAAFWLVFVQTLDRPVVRASIERSERFVSRTFGVLLVFLGMRVATMDR